jgi:hypothetical protein
MSRTHNKSRRNFIAQGLTLAAAAMASPSLVRAALPKAGSLAGILPPLPDGASDAAPPYEIRSTARAPWASIRILDTERMPLTVGPFAKRKRLFEDPRTGSSLEYREHPIGVPGAQVHYHTFHEWVFWLCGDFTNNESTSPMEHMGPLQRYREGTFLDRPAYSLHGGEKGREPFMESQIGGCDLVMEEGEGGNKGTFFVEPGTPGYNYSTDWKKVKQWTVPRLIDTIGGMPWEADPAVPGLYHKYLADDPSRGFRVILRRLAPGWNIWQSPRSARFARAYYYKQARQFNFMLVGDLNIQTYKVPEEKAEKITLDKYFFVDREPMSIFGLTDGIVSQEGCAWLEVTYAKGATVSTTPIEEPTYV